MYRSVIGMNLCGPVIGMNLCGSEINPHLFTQTYYQTQLVYLLTSPNILHALYFFTMHSLLRNPLGVKQMDKCGGLLKINFFQIMIYK